MRQYRCQASVDGDQISLNWMFLLKWIRMVLSIPLSASFHWPFATTSLLGHLLQQTADVPVFPVCGLGRMLCYPRLTSWNIALKRIQAKQQMLSKPLTCISTALATRLSVSMLSFGGRRDIETFHTKGRDSTNGWKSRWTLDNPSPSNTVMLLDRYTAGALWVQMRCCVL